MAVLKCYLVDLGFNVPLVRSYEDGLLKCFHILKISVWGSAVALDFKSRSQGFSIRSQVLNFVLQQDTLTCFKYTGSVSSILA